jgi:hypothetical protein
MLATLKVAKVDIDKYCTFMVVMLPRNLFISGHRVASSEADKP